MDFASIALGIYTVVSPFISKGLDKIVEKAAEEGYTERKAIWDKVKGLFVEDELTLLNLFKEAKTDEKAKIKLETKLETHLQLNEATAKELDELVKKVQEIEKKNSFTNTLKDITENSKVDIENDQSTTSGTDNKFENIIERVSGSTINIKNKQD
jgi:uncharacterized membrane protein